MIINNLAIETDLIINKDIKLITISSNNSTSNLDDLYDYLNINKNKTQFIITFCYD